MNEAETRAELINPRLKACGWGVVEGSKILYEYHITAGKIQTGGKAKPLIADYVLVYKGIKLAVVEAKSDQEEVGEGVAQAKLYAEKLKLDITYATNGKEIYRISMDTGEEGLVDHFLTPDELWNRAFARQNDWRDKFSAVPFEDYGKTKDVRYYQELAINNTMAAIADNKQRILLTLATGTGKTFIAFQIAWKLFHTRWTLQRDGKRRPRILFLADRNILADQAYNAFSAFPEDALVRIRPEDIRKKGAVPTNGSIFFTIFQTFMSGTDEEGNPKAYFGEYPRDYFDFIIIDECHRGGANDESNWRDIMVHFSPAVQLGLTATPKRKDNVDTYRYFGEPVYIYSLKEGINDGFLTPFKVKRIQTTLDQYIYTSDDKVIEGEIEEGRVYKEPDFNVTIEIKEREAERVKIFLNEANQKEKTIIFCASQPHAALIRDLVNQYKKSRDTSYCVRVTANDGEIGEQRLREFQDNEKSVPTVLTTSQKLSTGVDARNIRNIVLLRPINTMIEFKQIIGRGTRLFENKEYFTIYDFVDAYRHFSDPEWDGEPIPPEPYPIRSDDEKPPILSEPDLCDICGKSPCECNRKKKIKVKLADGKERQIQHMISTSFWSADGKPVTAEEFLKNMFGKLPEFFKSEQELRNLWSNPLTRKTLLQQLADAGYDKNILETLQKLIDAEKSDIFDVLEYVAFSIAPITREERVIKAQKTMLSFLNIKQKEFIDFVLKNYIEVGVEELDIEKLPILLKSKYHTLPDAQAVLGNATGINTLFTNFQKYLYDSSVA